MLGLLKLADHNISSSELSAFFRKKAHRHYRVCKDQILRKFLKGLQLKYTTANESSKTKTPPSPKQAVKKSIDKKPTKFSW